MPRASGKRLLAIVGLGIAAYTVGSMYQPTVVVGQSMSPTLPDGRVIYVDRTYYRTRTPAVGEVVVFSHRGDVYVKRVYRGPGETVYYLGDGVNHPTLISESKLGEFRRRYARARGRIRVRSLRVPDDCVYVLGDNFNQSEDSRELGPIPIRELIGRARVDVDATIAGQFELRPRPRPQFTPAETARVEGERRS